MLRRKLELLAHRMIARRMGAKLARRHAPGPIISFTFDDFPRSALTVGGRVLAECGLRGTYYTSMGLVGGKTSVGTMFSLADLETAAAQGHELACHTLDHLLCSDVDTRRLTENCLANQDRARGIPGTVRLRNFSYPEGVVTLAAKRALSSLYDSCRTIEPGLNLDPVDLGFLRANRIYSRPGIRMAKQLVRQNEIDKGWLIFYTHAVEEAPSPYGCTPEEFGEVVQAAVRSSAQILPVREALTRFDLPA